MPTARCRLYDFGDFRLDTQQRVLRRGEEQVPLTPKALEVLLLLIEHRGDVVSKDQLMRTVWPDSFVEESNLTQTVFMLRKALGEAPEQRYIVTAPGRGYRFACEVIEASGNGHAKSHPGTHSLDLKESPPRPASCEPARRRANIKAWVPFAAVVFCIVITATLITQMPWRAAIKHHSPLPGERLMLAVLPFENLTGDPGQDYFSDGLTEELIAQLGSLDVKHLGVIARTSVMHYKNNKEPLEQIGKELEVQYVLEGSVRRDVDQIRITVQLIQVKEQNHLWARQYDRQLGHVLALQGEVSQEITDEVQHTFGNNEVIQRKAPSFARPKNAEAYDLFWKGQFYLNKRTAADLRTAIKYFEDAIKKDPDYARAYAGLADCYALLGGYSGLTQPEFASQARAAALRALQIDPLLPEGHAALGLIVQNYDWDWQTAGNEFRRAIELNSNYATAYQWYAEHLMWRGRFEEALQQSEQARQLDPLSLIIAADNGAILYFSRDYDRAIQKWRSVLEMSPSFSRAQLIMHAYVEKQLFIDALEFLQQQRSNMPVQWYWSNLAYIAGRSGRRIESQRALDELLHSKEFSGTIEPVTIAMSYAGIKDHEHTLIWLEKAYARHSNELVTLKVNPAYDFLRTDRRFESLLHRVGLTTQY